MRFNFQENDFIGNWDKLSYLNHGPSLFHSLRKYFSRFNLLICIFIICGWIGFFHRVGILLALSEVGVCAYLYFSTKRIAEGISLSRIAPSRATEMDKIKIEIHIRNGSYFSLFEFILLDHFSGSKTQLERVWIQKYIPAFESGSIEYSVICDGGMGPHHFGPMKCIIQDRFGFFSFPIEISRQSKLMVYPKMHGRNEMNLQGMLDSYHYGTYEVQNRGHSTSLMGVREFAYGDALRHISWRLSAKKNKLMVKEFDRNVNAEISLLLDLTGQRHLGFKSESTWEYAKDLSISLLSKELEHGNSVQLLSNQISKPLGMGEDHRMDLILTISKLFPELDSDPKPYLERCLSSVQSGSTVFYVGPLQQLNYGSTLKSLKHLLKENVDVWCFFIDLRSFLEGLKEHIPEHRLPYLQLGSDPGEFLNQLGRTPVKTEIIKMARA